jgi:Taurine catabolism dioxygenase TauD, TfdA family
MEFKFSFLLRANIAIALAGNRKRSWSVFSVDLTAKRAESPFLLGNEAAYQRWRSEKVNTYPRRVNEIKVPIANPVCPTESERKLLLDSIAHCNMAIYVTDPTHPPHDDAAAAGLKTLLAAFVSGFGLVSVENHRSAEGDGFVSIEVSQKPSKLGFIPYTAKSLNWHTDGYYNPPQSTVRAMLLHCVRAAIEGGENALLDPEIAYIRIRDVNASWLGALMHPEAMIIPPSLEEDGSERPISIGPVFAVDAGGRLLMRYTARGRNIRWRDTNETRAAFAFLDDLLRGEAEPLIFKARLAPGEGIICNNVLHARTAFDDAAGSRRLILRARFANRIADVPVDQGQGCMLHASKKAAAVPI